MLIELKKETQITLSKGADQPLYSYHITQKVKL